MVGAEGEIFGFSHLYFAGNGHFDTMFGENRQKTYDQVTTINKYGERFIVPAHLSLRERCGNAPIVPANFQGLEWYFSNIFFAADVSLFNCRKF